VRFLPYAVAAWLLLVGLYGIVTSRNLVHAIICLSVAQSSTYILLLSVGFERGGTAPIFLDVPVGTKAVDPVVGALTLTDIVVGATVSALLLALAVQAHKHHGTLDPERLKPERDGAWTSCRPCRLRCPCWSRRPWSGWPRCARGRWPTRPPWSPRPW
jgi:multicomponent Na+:H+ antiporter subunit C